MHLPVEFLVIGTALTKRKNKVSSEEVAKYRKKCEYPLEWDSEGKLHYCTYDEKEDIYTVQNNLPLHPQIIQILTSF